MAIAWSWCHEKEIHVRLRLDGVEQMLDDFLAFYLEADQVTGHNILRHDLPILNAEYLRHGYTPLPPILAQDTMRIVRTKGFKKSQDNLLTLLRSPERKLTLNWQEWQDAYEEEGWQTVRNRIVSDVRGHKFLRQEMLRRGWLKAPIVWIP